MGVCNMHDKKKCTYNMPMRYKLWTCNMPTDVDTHMGACNMPKLNAYAQLMRNMETYFITMEST